MLRDRGVIKWTAMMLPEHVKRLKEWDAELLQDPTPPALTDWELTNIQQQVEIAYRGQTPITFTLFSNEQQHVETGLIQKIIPNKQMLLLETKNERKTIYFKTIRGAETDD